MLFKSTPDQIRLHKYFKHRGFLRKRIEKKRFTKNYWKLSYTMWFFLFLTFAIRIGHIWPFLFSDFTSFNIAQVSQEINLPTAAEAKIHQEKRHIAIISIDEFGNYKYSGDDIKFEKLKVIIQEGRENIDNFQIPDFKNLDEPSLSLVWGAELLFVLLIDKNCEMQYVNNLLHVLRENRFYQVLFVTSTKKESIV